MPPPEERAAWNHRYSEGSHGSLKPDPFLLQAYEDFVLPLGSSPGIALDVAGGIGRHSIWLAEREWQVTLIDISDTGVAQARTNAGELGRRIEFDVMDAVDFHAEEKFDLILVFFFLQREILPMLARALRPGGILLYKTYTTLQRQFSGGPSHPMHLLKENELLRAFPDLSVLYYRETVRERGIAEYVGRKQPAEVESSSR